MSYLNTKQALIEHLINVTIPDFSSSDIAFENRKFDPSGKDLWLACYFLPASTDILGKTEASGDEQRGIFQVSVFVNKNNDNFDNLQLNTIDVILSDFRYNTQLDYLGQGVDILSSTVTQGRESEAWFQRDISINYLTFSSRGPIGPIVADEPFNFQDGSTYNFQDDENYIFN